MFIARQPIFNRILKVHGYELLFRAHIGSQAFEGDDATKATATVLGGLFESGIEKLVSNTRAFVNFDYEFLFSDSIELVDPNSLIIEVLEDIDVDDELLDRLKFLKGKGYKIALDDFVEDYEMYPIVPIADIIKFDLIATPLDTIENEVKFALNGKKILLAEKVETREEFRKAKAMGFNLFQGYFFSKPKIVEKTNDKKSMKVQYFRILNELRKEEPSYERLVELFQGDVNLAYRLVSISSNRKNKDLISSIKNALVYMGFREIERWVNILMLQDLATNKPEELLRSSLVKSKFGELIGENSIYKERKSEISMMCLFSNIDVILDQTMEDALTGILLSDDIKQTLLYGRGKFQPICELFEHYEKGNWEHVKDICEEINVDCKILFQIYMDALRWADNILMIY